MNSPRTRRDMLAAVGVTVGSVGLAGCGSQSGGSDGSPTETAPSTTTATETETANGGAGDFRGEGAAVSALGIAGTDTDYAVMGSQDAAETATLYGGWKCPYTKEFVNQMLPAVVERYMKPGNLAIKFRAVRFQADESWGDDEPRANRAGQAVWHKAPKQFPDYVETLYRNQPSEQTRWATVEKLISLAKTADIDETQPIKESITSGEYTALWKATMDVVTEKGIKGIPRFELGEEITAPILNPEATERQLKRALE